MDLERRDELLKYIGKLASRLNILRATSASHPGETAELKESIAELEESISQLILQVKTIEESSRS
jgi:hypothetical protein